MGCSAAPNNKNADRPEQDSSATMRRIKADTSTIALFPYDTASYWLFEEYSRCHNAELSLSELDKVEELVQLCVTEYVNQRGDQLGQPEETTQRDPYRIARSGYVLQCIAVIDARGEKQVWVNALCNHDWPTKNNWRERIQMVEDGGGCYYQLKVNLSKGTYYDLNVNGVA
jgi:hypothetical protein